MILTPRPLAVPFAAIAAVAVFGITPPAARAQVVVTAPAVAAGKTPMYLGYNQGHSFTGGNTSAWVEYSGVNAFRVWANNADYEPENQTGDRSGAGITTLNHFEARKAAFRVNPESTSYTDWSTYNDRFNNLTQTGRNKVNLNFTFGQLKARGVSPIFQISRSSSTPYSGWGDRWEQWHFYYAMAYNAAKNYDVERFQMYNEPDLPRDNGQPTIAAAEWLDRMKISSDAVRSAVLDVNAKFGKSLKPDLSGPTGIHGQGTYDAYGKEAVRTNRTDYAGRAVAYDVMGTYDLHRYGTTPSAFTGDIDAVRAGMRADAPDGKPLPVTYTEFNARTSHHYSTSPDTLDTPAMFTAVAADVLGAMTRDVKAMYAFKFNQTDYVNNDGVAGVQKTGFFYSDNAAAPYDTTGATLGAETVRLLSRAFKGERPRFALSSTGGTLANYDLAGSYDAARDNHYLVGVNRNTAAAGYTLDVSNWGVAAGAVVSVEEVSAGRRGEVTQLITVPASRRIAINQPTGSVWMLTLPGGAAATVRSLTPVADAQIRNGDSATSGNRVKFYGRDKTDEYVRVGRQADGTNGDYVSYLKFDLGATDAATIDRAILQLRGQTLDGPEASFHVYAITDDTWTETGINWNNAPGIGGALDAALAGVGATATPVGSLTFGRGLETTGIDVTDFLLAHPQQVISFALVREEKFAGDAEAGYARLFSNESAAPPTLTIFGGAAVPEPATMLLLAMPAIASFRRRRLTR